MCVIAPDVASNQLKNAVSDIVAHSVLPSFSISGLEHRTLVSRHTGAKHIELWQDEIYPGAATPKWRHNCEAAITVLQGTGEFRREGVVVAFTAPCSWCVPTDVEYQVINTDKSSLVLLTALSSGEPHTTIDDGAKSSLPWQSADCAQRVTR